MNLRSRPDHGAPSPAPGPLTSTPLADGAARGAASRRAAPRPPAAPPRVPRLRRWLRSLHLWLGLSVGVVFALLGISGTVLVFQPELLRLQHPALFAQPAPDDAAIARGLARLLAQPPEGVTGGDLPRMATPYWQLYTVDGRRLYLDAPAERLLLVRSTGNDWVLWLRDLHTHLLAGHTGEQVGGVVGLIGLFLLLSGLYLWWPRPGGWWNALRWYRGPPVRRWLSWHRSLGTIGLPVLLLVTLTGVAMVWSGAARSVLATVLADAPDPPAPAAIPLAMDAAPADAADPHRLLAAARAALPHAHLARFAVPAADDARLVFRARAEGEWHPFGRSLVWTDRARGEAITTSDATRLAPAARATHAIYPLHGGTVGGWPWRLAVAVSGLMPAFLLVTGALLWWRRRRAAGALRAATN